MKKYKYLGVTILSMFAVVGCKKEVASGDNFVETSTSRLTMERGGVYESSDEITILDNSNLVEKVNSKTIFLKEEGEVSLQTNEGDKIAINIKSSGESNSKLFLIDRLSGQLADTAYVNIGYRITANSRFPLDYREFVDAEFSELRGKPMNISKNENSNTFDVSFSETGDYFIKIAVNGKELIKKVSVQDIPQVEGSLVITSRVRMLTEKSSWEPLVNNEVSTGRRYVRPDMVRYVLNGRNISYTELKNHMKNTSAGETFTIAAISGANQSNTLSLTVQSIEDNIKVNGFSLSLPGSVLSSIPTRLPTTVQGTNYAYDLFTYTTDTDKVVIDQDGMLTVLDDTITQFELTASFKGRVVTRTVLVDHDVNSVSLVDSDVAIRTNSGAYGGDLFLHNRDLQTDKSVQELYLVLNSANGKTNVPVTQYCSVAMPYSVDAVVFFDNYLIPVSNGTDSFDQTRINLECKGSFFTKTVTVGPYQGIESTDDNIFFSDPKTKYDTKFVKAGDVVTNPMVNPTYSYPLTSGRKFFSSAEIQASVSNDFFLTSNGDVYAPVASVPQDVTYSNYILPNIEPDYKINFSTTEIDMSTNEFFGEGISSIHVAKQYIHNNNISNPYDSSLVFGFPGGDMELKQYAYDLEGNKHALDTDVISYVGKGMSGDRIDLDSLSGPTTFDVEVFDKKGQLLRTIPVETFDIININQIFARVEQYGPTIPAGSTVRLELDKADGSKYTATLPTLTSDMAGTRIVNESPTFNRQLGGRVFFYTGAFKPATSSWSNRMGVTDDILSTLPPKGSRTARLIYITPDGTEHPAGVNFKE